MRDRIWIPVRCGTVPLLCHSTVAIFLLPSHQCLLQTWAKYGQGATFIPPTVSENGKIYGAFIWKIALYMYTRPRVQVASKSCDLCLKCCQL